MTSGNETLARRSYRPTNAILMMLVVISTLSAAAPQGTNDASDPENAENLVAKSDCSSCHANDHAVVGPAYTAIAKRYAGQSDALEKLIQRVRQGGAGTWGTSSMNAHPELSDRELRAMVKWILSLGDRGSGAASERKEYNYTTDQGITVKLDFPLFVAGKEPKVTKDVFRGYQLYNSYCYRCHGQDATGGQLAPDLRRSLAVGMKEQEFLAVTMTGRKESGMPSWAGFFNEEEVRRIYQYVKGRSVDLVRPGRPPSETE